jgi:predicted Zn-dependent peptidase
VRFPPISRAELSSGLRVWFLPWHVVPVVSVALVLDVGSAADPVATPGLAALTADLVDEGAGGRDTMQLSDAFARLGTHLDVDVGQDGASLSFTTLARNLDPALALLADVLSRPHLAETDFQRIRDLRLSRLRQLSTSASAAADRAFLAGVFGSHPYGHGTLGTTPSLQRLALDDARQFHAAMFAPEGATLIVVGDLDPTDVETSVRAHLEGWRGGQRAPEPPIASSGPAIPALLLIDRPGAPQSELRVGHLGPLRRSPAYHALVTLNAALGGQFTSRINQHLREAKGYTYGARTGLDFRRAGSTLACETSVQSDATANAIEDILAEFDAVRGPRPLAGDELGRAQSSLTRGYVRHFETPAHLVRAAAELVRFSLAADTFDRFVPEIAAVNEAAVLMAAKELVRPEEATAVVVGDAERCRGDLARFGRPIVEVAPEF